MQVSTTGFREKSEDTAWAFDITDVVADLATLFRLTDIVSSAKGAITV